jgi:ubiquinone/menaquinone biosynthesis C-methylase UbiE
MEDYLAANRKSWNQAAPIHRRYNFADLTALFSQPGYSRLDTVVTAALQKIGLHGKRVAQLCCNNGRELLSIKNLGAARVTGFDISDDFIQQAVELASSSKIEAEFVRSSVQEIPACYDHSFDLVFISIGSLGWMPDIRQFFAIVARLLAPGGWMAMYEMHPILDMFESSDLQNPPPLRYSYFRSEPFMDSIGHDYYQFTTYESAPSYWFHHKLGDIFQACLENGLTIRHFEEFDHDLSSVFAHFEKLEVKPPLSYLLIGEKSA